MAKIFDSKFTWPRITIVTPSYNQGQYLEETIRSVLSQGYPNLEYIVMDGGSIDNSVDIIRRYEAQIAYWESQPDGGQSAAIQSGFGKASGVILGYLNSDDVLLPGSLEAIGRFYASHKSAGMIVGKSLIIDSISRIQRPVWGFPPTFYSLLFWGTGGFNQPASFWTREAFFDVGGLDPSLHFAFDYDFYTRLSRKKYKIMRIDTFLAAFRYHETSKTSTLQSVRVREDALVQHRNGIEIYPALLCKLAYFYYECRYRLFALWFRFRWILGLEHSPTLISKEIVV